MDDLAETPHAGLHVQGLVHWNRIRRDRPLPGRRDLDPVDFPRLLEFSCLVEVLQGGQDFRYLIIGSAIQFASSPGQTGMKLSEMPTQRRPSRVFNLFSAVVDLRQPRFTRLDYVGDDARVRDVDVAAFPLACDERMDLPGFIWTLVQLNAKG